MVERSFSVGILRCGVESFLCLNENLRRCLLKRSYLLAVALLIVMGILMDWRLSGANTEEQPAPTLDTAEVTEVAKLTSRIDALERRITILEKADTLIRQADSRAAESANGLAPVPDWKPRPSNESGDNDNNETQKTNGQSWRFRLLSNGGKGKRGGEEETRRKGDGKDF